MLFGGISSLERLIDPDNGNFTADVAKYFLAIDFTPEQHARCEALSGKAASGTLSESEAAELDELLAANALLTVLQSKARQSIHRQTPAA
jgi:uncharacterized protein with NAD-binding domain and iron-sulfur cluster